MRLPAILCLSALFVAGCKSPAGTENRVYKAPAFELADMKGKTVSLASLKGKVVFIDFWATWCPPCIISLPEVEKLGEAYKGKNFVVLSISLDSSKDPVERFMSRYSMSNPVLFAGTSNVDAKYGIEGIPAYFIIDQQGNIAEAWQGYAPSMPALWRKRINQLLQL